MDTTYDRRTGEWVLTLANGTKQAFRNLSDAERYLDSHDRTQARIGWSGCVTRAVRWLRTVVYRRLRRGETESAGGE